MRGIYWVWLTSFVACSRVHGVTCRYYFNFFDMSMAIEIAALVNVQNIVGMMMWVKHALLSDDKFYYFNCFFVCVGLDIMGLYLCVLTYLG